MTNVDYWYDKWFADKTSNACILRVTNQCNERCTHCCFRSGPECVGQMSIEMCKEINTWIPKKILPNIMGGEFSVLNNYPEILIELARHRNHVRLVTNGFWSRKDKRASKFIDTIKQIKDTCPCIDVVISNDRWHVYYYSAKLLNNKVTKFLANSPGINLINCRNLDKDDIVPVGRAWDNHITPNEHVVRSCEYMSNMIITEDGIVCRCPFGYFPWKHFSETTWVDAQEYIWGWRSEKLAEGMNCHLCMKAAQRGGPGSGNP